MQIGTWDPPVRQNSMPGPHQTLFSTGCHPTQQMGFSNLQQSSSQQSARLSDPRAFSQPVSSPAYLPSNQTQQTWTSGYWKRIDGHPAKVVLHYYSLQAGQVTHSSEKHVLNTPNQRNYNNPHCMQNISSTPHNLALPVQNCVSVNSCFMNESNPPLQVPLSGQHQKVQTTHQTQAPSQQAAVAAQMNHPALTMSTNQGQTGGIEHHHVIPESDALFPATSRIPADLFPHSLVGTSSSQMSESQVSSQIPQQLDRASSNPANQSLTTQTVNQPLVQQRTFPSQTKTNTMADVSAIQSSRQPQVLPSSNSKSLPSPNSEMITSCRTSTSQKSTSPNSTKYSKNVLLRLLLENDTQQLLAFLSGAGFASQFAKSKSGTNQPAQDSTSGSSANALNDTQCKSWQGKVPQKPAEETGISMGSETRTDSHLAEPHQTSQNATTNRTKRSTEMQDPGQRSSPQIVRQANMAVAVVTPTSPQCFSHRQQNDPTTSLRDSVPLNPDTAKNTFDECKKLETNVANVTLNLNEDVPQLPLYPSSLSKLRSETDTSNGVSEIPRSQNAGSEHCQSSQCGDGSASNTQTSTICQDAVRVVDPTSNSSVQQNDDQRLESSTDDTPFDRSTVPAIYYTLKDLRDLVNLLGGAPEGKSTVPNVMKCILDLYYFGDHQNITKDQIVACQEIIKNSSNLGVNETNAVVLQKLQPEDFEVLQSSSQILNNETTFPAEDFRSSWLNVDDVLAEPILDYGNTWCEKFSHSVSENVKNVVDSSAQTANAEDLAVHVLKDEPKTTTSEDICLIDPEVSRSKLEERTLDDGCASRTSDEFSMMERHSKTPFSESSDTCVTNSSDEFEEANRPKCSPDISSDLCEIIILSSEEARKIFTECFKHEIKPQRIPQGERKEPDTPCDKNHSGDSKVKPLDDLKFSCSHVSGSACGSDFFCSKCWLDTPLFNIDQDEILLSPEDVEPDTDSQKPSHSQADPETSSREPVDYPSAPACQESGSIISSITSTPISDGPEVTRDPNEAERSSPTPGREPYHGTKNSGVVKPGAAGTQMEDLKKVKAVSPIGTRIRTGTVSPSSSSCKNVQFPKTDAVPKPKSFHNCTPKHHPRDRRSMSCDGDQARDENTILGQLSPKTKTPSQKQNITTIPEHRNAVRLGQKRPIGQDNGPDGQSKETKKFRLELYGSNRTTSSCSDTLKSTPVFITISPNSDTGNSYTDNPSAKKKVYKQWISSFVQPQKNSSKSLKKKRPKHVKDCLRLKIQALKLALRKDRNQ